jgi:hypothetical protein
METERVEPVAVITCRKVCGKTHTSFLGLGLYQGFHPECRGISIFNACCDGFFENVFHGIFLEFHQSEIYFAGLIRKAKRKLK